jgi:hypothetical protein
MRKTVKKYEAVLYFSVFVARIRIHPMLCAPQTVGFWDAG